MDIQRIQAWFNNIQASALYTDPDSSIEYINANSHMVHLPDHSRTPEDLIIFTAARISKKGFYDISIHSLSKKEAFSASFPISNHYLTSEHSHNYIELAFVLKGTMCLRFGNQNEKFEEGEICLIKHGILHSDLLERDDTIILYLGIADDFFDRVFLADFVSHASERFVRDIIVEKRQQHDFVRFTPRRPSPLTVRLYLEIFREFQENRPGCIRLIQGYTERILCLLPSEFSISLTNIEHRKYLYYVYLDVKAYIEKHYATVTVSELSSVFGYNPDYFNRLIRRFSGNSYSSLLQSTRLKEAADLLETSSHSVETISRLVGYSNLGFFYRSFYARYGCTPGEYRKK